MQNIIIETCRLGRRFTVGVWPFDTIREMKETIEKCQDFPVASQGLFFKGKLLDDKQLAETYGLFDPAAAASPVVKLAVKPVPGLKLRLTIISAVPDVRFSLRYDVHEPLGTLKKRIHELEGIPADRLAFFLGKFELRGHDGSSFASLRVIDHLEMRLVVQSMTIKIVGTSTEHFLNQDASGISVGGFREKIRASLRIPADRQVLLFLDGCDRELREDRGRALLSDHGVTDRSVVNVVANKPPGADKVRLRIKTRRLDSVSIFYMEVRDASEPVTRLKESIGKFERIPASWIQLFICGWKLRDDWPLGYYGVVDTCSVLVTWEAKPVPGVVVRLKIKIAGGGGSGDDRPPLLLDQDVIEPVGGVKERIGESLGVPVERLKLLSKWGRELEDDGKALGYCVVIDDPVLSVVLKARLTIQVPKADADCDLDLLGDPTESVGALKKRVHETLADVDHHQHSTSLFMGECELEDVRTLDNYGVTDGSVVKMITRKRGRDAD